VDNLAREGITQSVHLVGDTMYDAEAAMNAGLRSIIVRRDGTSPAFGHDYFINSLTGVASIVVKE